MRGCMSNGCYRICSIKYKENHKCTLQWRYNEHDSVSNHQPHDCLLNRLFRHRSKKTPKLCVTGLCAENSPGTCEFPAQMASDAENVSIWSRHHVLASCKGDNSYVIYSPIGKTWPASCYVAISSHSIGMISVCAFDHGMRWISS